MLGDNPFIGVSHLAQEKSRSELHEATLDNILNVVEASVDSGATGFTFSTHPKNLELLLHIRNCRRDLLGKLNYYLLVPYVEMYIRKANEEGTPALTKSVISNLLRRNLSLVELAIATLTVNPGRLAGVFVESEISPFLRILPKNRLRVVLLHEVLTELIMAFRLNNLLLEIDSHVRTKLGMSFGLETRNFGQLRDFIIGTGYTPEFVMTPINKLGYQMAPDRKKVEEVVTELGERSKIIAINILASGALNFCEAVDYLSRFRNSLYAIVSATIKPKRARENFSILTKKFVY